MSDPKQTEETIDIDSSGNAVSIRMLGAELVSLHINGDAVAEYQWDGRIRGGSWINDIGPAYTGQSDYDDVVETALSEVRVRCSSGSGGSGDQSTITLSAGGG